MLLRNRWEEPLRCDLAVFNPKATLDKYQEEITEASMHWQLEECRGDMARNKALIGTASPFVEYLVNLNNEWRNDKRPKVRERTRRTVLSALGVSMLLRAEWGDDNQVLPSFVGPEGQLGIVNDLVVDMPPRWQDFRVHTPMAIPESLPQSDGRQSQWYKEGELWMRQSRPVDPTHYLANIFLPQLGYHILDLSGHETLFPYIASR